MTGMRIRRVVETDFNLLLELNNAAVPAVNALISEDLARFAAIAVRFQVAVAEGRPVGLMIALGPGLDYDSLNYRWFDARFEDYLYIDRIVVDPTIRSMGIGVGLYQDLERAARASGVRRLACEVNLQPPNERSLAFHQRLGFRGVGTQDTENGAKTVQLMVWDLEC